MKIQEIMEMSFGHRQMPLVMATPPNYPVDCIKYDSLYSDCIYFTDRDWKSLNCSEIEDHSDLIYGCTPEAYCYLLPGVLCAFHKKKKTESFLIDILIQPLIDGYEALSSNQFYFPRWSLLNQDECAAVQEWLDWYSEVNVDFKQNSYKTALMTLSMLRRLAKT